MPIGIYINRKLYINIKNEKRRENGKVIQQIIKIYSIVQPILSAITYILITPKESFEIFEKLEPVLRFFFIQLFRFLFKVSVYYISLNSLVIAFCQYMFIVFHERADNIGITRLKNFFIGISIGLPIGLAVLHCSVISGDIYPQKLPGCGFFSFGNLSRSTDEITKGCMETMFQTMENPVYCFIQENFNDTLVAITRIMLTISTVIIFSNILEGFIYVHTFMYSIRYEKL